MVGGDGRGAQLEDVAPVVHVDGAGLARGQGHDGLGGGKIAIINAAFNVQMFRFCRARSESYFMDEGSLPL